MMDSLLIDFNSPKLRREDAPLIPGSLLVPMLASNRSGLCCMTTEESNPFDMVDGQVAANFAAENDPFEMVLNDAINCQATKKEDPIEEIPKHTQLSNEKSRKSLSLPDLQYVSDEVFSQSHDTNYSSLSKENGFSSKKASSCCTPSQLFQESDYENVATCGNSDSTEWDYLDDIPPPDSLLNSTVDMSCFLDDTLPTAVCSMHSKSTKQEKASEQCSTDFQRLENLKMEEFPQATYKSDEELRMFALKKIENIITKAKLEVQNDIQDSVIQRRLSTQGPSFPNQEALALCTPKRTRDIQSKPSKEMSLSLKEWSQNEMVKLKLIFPESAPTPAQVSLLMPDIDKVDITLLHKETNVSFLEMPVENLSFSSPLSKGKSGNSSVSVSEVQKPIAVSHPSSPILLPLPLCEDAVRNLSLCSKYSPPLACSHSKHQLSGDLKTVNATKDLGKTGAQAKLLVRKPVVSSKKNSKMAPMKATAPVQNMTRARSAKPEMNNSSVGVPRKPASKEHSSIPAPSENTHRFLRMPQSPSRAMSSSLPNLSSQGSKLPSRLPSPRRPSVTLQESKNLENRLENAKEKNTKQVSGSSAFHSSPRPVRKGCLSNRPGGHSRVLADVNSCLSGRLSLKCRIASNQSDTPRRGRSLLTEKENFL